jgi:hypothetical protein
MWPMRPLLQASSVSFMTPSSWKSAGRGKLTQENVGPPHVRQNKVSGVLADIFGE